MRNRSRNLGSVRCVRHKVATGVLLLSVIPYSLIPRGKSNVAAASTGDDMRVSRAALLAQNDASKT